MHEILHIVLDALRNAVLITGMVVTMMMMIEALNIESRGLFFKGLRKTRLGQVVVASLLGSIPGCMGGFAAVSLYTHKMLSFGALTAMLIATSGDESFVMLAMFPEKALLIFAISFVTAVVAGYITDLVHDRIHRKHCNKTSHEDCGDTGHCVHGYELHHEESDENTNAEKAKRHFSWKRLVLSIGLAAFITALATGRLEHDHSGHEGHHHECTEQCVHIDEDAHNHTVSTTHNHNISLLDEAWMNVLFAALSVIMLLVIIFGSDHFVNEHLWHHVIVKHLPGIFGWTFSVLLIVGIGLNFWDLGNWVSDNAVTMIFIAAAIGFIPESGPHMIFVTLFAAGVIPMPVLLASCISQDGHASIPLLAESKRSFFYAKMLNFAVAVAVSLFVWWIF